MRSDVISATGKRLKAARLELGVNQQKFAEKIRVTRGFISQVENEISDLSPATMLAIEHKWNISIEYLESGRGPMFLDGRRSTESIRAKMGEDSEQLRIGAMILLSSYIAQLSNPGMSDEEALSAVFDRLSTILRHSDGFGETLRKKVND